MFRKINICLREHTVVVIDTTLPVVGKHNKICCRYEHPVWRSGIRIQKSSIFKTEL